MVEIRELQSGVEVVATNYRERFRNRFKAIMAAHALAHAESALHGGCLVDIIVPTDWGEGYMTKERESHPVADGANARP